ncbi:PEPxxWA-CTERM sorting domain-containing protein [Sphingomonas mollis]|uniref:PEP-CTERM sorting domain-containing protein n=1 Tax=Sphingomonas mollis TaxID=2795726 RepID=A0ABS0XRW9_9SPHN|nr:PEPxxWA-CTERM sorting domain-containing protein [Sphingomonas sp. BT553]MBJ6122797.1 PEP-CTERM sorting domain-containing protein [Sphingomonas sp. BT553]
MEGHDCALWRGAGTATANLLLKGSISMVMKIAAVAGLFTAIASPASAATFVTQLGSAASFAAPAGTAITFDGALPTGFSLTPTNSSIVSGDLANQYAQPAFSDGSRYLAVLNGGSAVLQSTTGFDSVSFFLGSIDSFNSVQLLSTTGQVIGTFAGSLFTANANGNQDIPQTNRRVTFTRSAGDAMIGGINFISGGNSLEVDNVVFAVPEPSTWALMFLGFGMVGTAMRYRRRSKSVTYA